MTAVGSFQSRYELLLAGEKLSLLPQRAVWWERQQTVFVADLHLGKEATFRAAAIPVPDQTQQNLDRLASVIRETAAERLIILGDLIHARRGRCAQTFGLVADWRREFPDLVLELIRGNHDTAAGDPPADWNVTCRSEPAGLPPFDLLHHPDNVTTQASLAGHLHPMVRLGGAGRDSARLPCFLLRDNVLTFPAFSSFVDGAVIKPRHDDQIFAICEQQILKVL